VAPIALYPDPLVAQTLMASTYPLEVIEAARFAKASDRARTRCERGKDRIESLHHGVLAADHQAISALAAPDATARSNIHVVNALLGKVFRAPDIVHVIGMAAVDDNVARRRVREHLIEGRVHGGGRDHQPHRPWRLETARGVSSFFTRSTTDAAPTALARPAPRSPWGICRTPRTDDHRPTADGPCWRPYGRVRSFRAALLIDGLIHHSRVRRFEDALN